MPRTLNPILEAALDSTTFSPIIRLVLVDTRDSTEHTFPAVRYTLTGLSLTISIQNQETVEIDRTFFRAYLSRGAKITGVEYVENSSTFYIVSIKYTQKFTIFECNIFPDRYYSALAADTYENVITDICTNYGKTAVFLDPAAAWLDYQFFPAGRSLTLSNAQKFFSVLKQKYFIFATDNGSDEILFFTANERAESADHNTDVSSYEIETEESIKRKLVWRDENNTVHYSDAALTYTDEAPRAPAAYYCDILVMDNIILTCDVFTEVIRRSEDGGATWATVLSHADIRKLCNLGGGVIIAAVGTSIYRSTDYGENWASAQDTTYPIYSLCNIGSGTALALVSGVISGGNKTQVYQTTDYGTTWAFKSQIAAAITGRCLLTLDNGDVLASVGSSLYTSPNNGTSWTLAEGFVITEGTLLSVTDAGAGKVIVTTGIPSALGIAAGQSSKIWQSTDYGLVWTTLYTLNNIDDGATHYSSAIHRVIVQTPTLWFAVSNFGLYRSEDAGATWQNIMEADYLNSYAIREAATLDATHFFIVYNGLYLMDVEAIEEFPIYNIGYLESTALPPTHTTQSLQPKFAPLPFHLKYLTSDYITANLLPSTDLYHVYRAQITEIFDYELKEIPWRIKLEQCQYMTDTEGGQLPSTIQAAAPYTPLSTIGFNNNLDASVNNLQALADKVDDLVFVDVAIDDPTATNDFLVGEQVTGVWTWVKKTFAQTITILRTSLDSTYLQITNAREKLTAARTYYVRTDGSDSNTGLVDSAGGAFLTIQKAYDVIRATLDTAGYTVTIQCGAATYTAGLTVAVPWAGGGQITLKGDETTPANCIISVAQSLVVTCVLPSILTITGFKLTGTNGINHSGVGMVQFKNIAFDAMTGVDLTAGAAGATIECTGNYSVTGNRQRHLLFSRGAVFILDPSLTVTHVSTPAYSVAFADFQQGGIGRIFTTTFTGAATGVRYTVTLNAVLNTGGQTLPGGTAGTTATGGQYA